MPTDALRPTCHPAGAGLQVRKKRPVAPPSVPCQHQSKQRQSQQQQAHKHADAVAAQGAAPAPTSAWARLHQALSSPYDHAIFTLAAPAVLALAAEPLLGIIDTAFMGQLGADNLVGSALYVGSARVMGRQHARRQRT